MANPHGPGKNRGSKKYAWATTSKSRKQIKRRIEKAERKNNHVRSTEIEWFLPKMAYNILCGAILVHQYGVRYET